MAMKKCKQLYLNVIKGELQIREYKTKNNVSSFTWEDVIRFYGHETGACWNSACWEFHIEDIYNYLIHGVNLIYVDANGVDRLTDKGQQLLDKKEHD